MITLVHSRHQYVHVAHRQTFADLIAGLEDAFAFFGGVPKRVVLDNLKAAITKADRYDPLFARTFSEYAQYRGFVIDAAVARHPQGKPHVERQVQYVRENFFRGEQWLGREHVQREVVRWCVETAGQRIHGTTRKRPMAVFETVERKALQPLVRPRFDPPTWKACKVHPDHHLQFEKALYSVPTRHVGKQVWVRGDSKLVRVFVDGECVKTHERMGAGERSTDYSDYPKERAAYAMRDPETLITTTRRRGEHIGRFAEELLRGDFPWARLRQGQKLVRLAERYGNERVDAACRRALAFGMHNVRRVEAIVVDGLDRAPAACQEGELIPLPARFLRPTEHFTHGQNEENDDDGDPELTQDRDEAPEALGPDGDAARPGRVREEDEAR